MNETVAKGLLILAVMLGCAGAGAFAMHDHDQKAYTKLAAEAAKFKGAVETATKDFERQKAEYEAKGKSDKEKVDENYKRALAAARDESARLRVERDDERGKRFLAEKPTGSRCPDGQVCFDEPLFRAAYGVLVKDLRGVADSCKAVDLALESAMEWAVRGD